MSLIYHYAKTGYKSTFKADFSKRSVLMTAICLLTWQRYTAQSDTPDCKHHRIIEDGRDPQNLEQITKTPFSHLETQRWWKQSGFTGKTKLQYLIPALETPRQHHPNTITENNSVTILQDERDAGSKTGRKPDACLILRNHPKKQLWNSHTCYQTTSTWSIKTETINLINWLIHFVMLC